MADMSKLSDDDLRALHAKDFSKLSDDGLKFLYEMRQGNKPAAPAEKKIDPTDGMSRTEKFVAGYGKAASDLYRGAKQRYAELANFANTTDGPVGALATAAIGPGVAYVGRALGMDDQYVAQLEKEADETKARDAALMDTREGFAGNMIGAVANSIPAMFVPGANTYTGAAATGSFLGALQPTGEDDSAALNAGLGGTLGVAGQAVGRMIPGAYNAVKSYLAPLTETGQNRIVGDLLRNVARPGALDDAANAVSRVPGYQPLLAEATDDAGLAAIQKAVRNNPEVRGNLIAQETANKRALIEALRGLAGDDAQMAAARQFREAASGPLYQAARNSRFPEFGFEREMGQLQRIISRLPRGVLNDALDLARQEGRNIDPDALTPDVLHYVKLSLDKQLGGQGLNALDRVSERVVTGTKNDLVSWMRDNVDNYAMAMDEFAEASRPINQMQVGQALYEKMAPAVNELADGPVQLTPASYAKALRDAEQLIRSETGMSNRTLADVMTPEQMQVIEGVNETLGRYVRGANNMAASGSDTAQNLATQSMLRRVLGPLGLPESWAEGTLANNLVKGLMSPYRLTNADADIMSRLANAVRNPQLAAQLARDSAQNTPNVELINALMRIPAPAVTSGAYAGHQ